jgi:hypothetical protein
MTENIKLSVYDLFAYMLPGALCLIAISILFNPSAINIQGLLQSFKAINITTGILVGVFAYVIGHVMDTYGSWLHYSLGCRIWGQPYPKEEHPSLNHSQLRALIRQYSLENYAYLQTWKVLKTMSHNLAFALIVFMVVSLIRLTQFPSFDWLFLSIASLFCWLSLLRRAQVYDTWHYKGLLETVQVLQLEKRIALVTEDNKPKDLKAV